MSLRAAHVFAANGLNNIIWGCSQELCDDGKLVHVILAREQRFALEHFCEDATCAPNIDFYVVLLPSEHDLRCSVVARRDVTRHLRILYAGQTEIANLEIAVLVDQDVARFQVSVYDSRGVNVFQTTLEELAETSPQK